MTDPKDISIAEVLELLGARRAGKDMYYSTFREDKNPSMSVSFSKNVWYDYGVGKGGGPVGLVMETLSCSYREALDFLEGKVSGVRSYPRLEDSSSVESDKHHGIKVISVRKITSARLFSYGLSRGIPKDILSKYCREAKVEFTNSGKRSTFLSFENNLGGYTLRSVGSIKLSTSSGITTFSGSGIRTTVPSSVSVFVFEGFFDFLSWIKMVRDGEVCGEGDSVVLNSVANVECAMAFVGKHSEMISYLDNDDAGGRCLDIIRKRFPEMRVTDMTKTFGGMKDLNEVLVSRMKTDGISRNG